MAAENATNRARLTAAERERQLLDVAEELFTARGYEGVSIEDIARTAQVTRPIVYHHYGSKDGIFLACVRRARTEFEDAFTSATSSAGTDIPAAIEAGATVFFDVLARNPRRWALLFASSTSLSGDLSEQLTDLRFTTIARIVDVARPHAPEADEETLEAFAHAISGIGEQLGRWWVRNPDIPLARVKAHYCTIVGGAAASILAP